MTEEELLQVIEQAAAEEWTELDLSGNNLTILPPEIGKLIRLKKLILSKYEYDEDGDIVGTIGNNLKELPKEIGLLAQLEELRIVENQLSELPAEIVQLANLQSLELSGNQLSELPAEIVQLTNLQSLELNYNQLSELPAEIVQLANLQSLELNYNQLSELPAEIVQLTNLQSLELSGNQLSELPAEIVQLTNLQSLELSGNQLSELPAEIVQLANLQSLELNYNQLSELPAEIVQLTNLQSLELNYNQLSELPAEIVQLTNLQSLELNDNQLSELPAKIEQLTNLQSLDISLNKLSELPAEIGQLIKLQSLGLNYNQLSELPAEIGQLTNLQCLEISSNKLNELPAEIVQLTNLQSLELNYNQLSELPAEIVQLTNLQCLEISSNKLSELPAEIVQLTNLQSLELSGNKLSKLPAEIVQLTNLQSLAISSNKLSELPAEIVQLTKLQLLNLSRNQLSELPAEIGQLTKLQLLNLSRNQLSELPAEIGQLTKLQSLELSSNKLSKLPAEIVQLTNLQYLELNYNQLSELPAEIGQLTNLRLLNLNDNQLSKLPAEIVQLTNLQLLYLNDNQLSELPSEIVQLTNLQLLYLNDNQLSKLPAEIVQFTNLQLLYLNDNQLSELPETIKKLTKLEKLDLRGNPVPIPPEILGVKELWRGPGDVKEILDFYFRVQNPDETEPLYEAKLLIVGEGEAGKTSLAKKIEDEKYQLQPNEKSTEGIDVIQWKFPLLNGKEFRVNIWDFGGQEIYHQTHQFFLSERSLYVLVADNRRENPNFYWWLKVVELLSGNSPVLIIKNEKQDYQCEVNERELRGEFTNLQEVLATNLATNRGLDKIKQEIQNYITRLPHIGDKSPLPRLWIKVRLAIENYSRNYISQEEYYQLCKINKLRDRKDMLRLSRYLHDLGICLHFQDDSTLKHYVILKPEWATTAVYKVLKNNTIKQSLGCFTQAQLADIWQDSEYSDMQDELLQLMMRFKLCYPIPNRPGNYIAPQLLDIEQPTYNWDKSHNLILRYKYDFMPKGILTRFIVETHPWIEQQKLVWKSGVVLNKDETRAEVIENYNQREIKVRLWGNRKKDLLTVVNHELEKIHRSYERLKYETLVPCNCSKCIVSENPYSYSLENLRKRLNAGRYQVECEKSYEMVNVRGLIDDVNLSLQPEYRESNIQSTPLQQELETERSINLNFNIQQQGSFGVGVNKGKIEAEEIVGTINEAQQQSIAEAAAEIQTLLEQLEKSYPTDTTAGKMALATEAIQRIDSNPNLTARILSAFQVGSVKAFEQFLNNPAASFVIGALEDWQKTERS